MSFLDQLNDAQRKAAENFEGPCMVIAGAGSGKTRVLTFRIAHMISSGVDAFNILSLTFTNKAAREMKKRIAGIISEREARNIWMGTFHSVFARILRSEAEKLGYPSNFTIYDTSDAKNLIKAITKELGLDDKIYKPNLVYNRISSAKNNLVGAKAYMSNTTIQANDRQAAKPRIGEIYEIYEKRCFKAGAMDFDDLLFKTNILLRDFPDILHKYQTKFKYILVDEFQDTNYSQSLIIKQLAAKFENICVVGDDAQSIYAFRGANIQNILNFKRNYPDTKVYKLEQNYRSTQSIVKAANSVIKNNKEQLEKDVWTSNEEGDRIKVLKSLTDNEEGLTVASEIFREKQTNALMNSDFAILYRTNAQSRSMEEALRRKDIPYKIYGGLSFYQRKEIKDLCSYYRLIINPSDEEALKRVINYPARGIGKTSFDKIIIGANANDTSLWNVVQNPAKYGVSIGSAAANKMKQFSLMISSYQAQLSSKPAYELGKEMASTSGILSELYNDKTPEGVSRYENIQELLNGLKEFSEKADAQDQKNSLDVFMQDIALLTDADSEKEGEDNNKVTLMTIHASKGLEFPYVYLVGMEENLFPSQLALNSRDELEEERRLFYVAITRAEKKLTLSYAASRYKWGNLIYCEPSRFIEEIDPEFLDAQEVRQKKEAFGTPTRVAPDRTPTPTMVRQTMKKVTSSTTNTINKDVPRLVEGNKVEHDRFGKGEVKNIEGPYPNQKATILFPNHGEKKLLLKFAKLKVLN